MAKKVTVVEAQAEPEVKVPGRYRVELICPTPLAHPTMVVDADGEGQARKLFCEANGICDSVHQWKIQRVA